MTHNEAIAYCAGIFDGEGSIGIRKWINRRKRPDGTVYARLRYELEIEVNQVSVEAVQMMQRTLGGRLHFLNRYKARKKDGTSYSGRWFWKKDSRQAVDALLQLLPYLTIKREEAELAIAFQKTKLDINSGRSFKLGRTPEEITAQEAFYLDLKRLKQLHNHPDTQEHYISLTNGC